MFYVKGSSRGLCRFWCLALLIATDGSCPVLRFPGLPVQRGQLSAHPTSTRGWPSTFGLRDDVALLDVLQSSVATRLIEMRPLAHPSKLKQDRAGVFETEHLVANTIVYS